MTAQSIVSQGLLRVFLDPGTDGSEPCDATVRLVGPLGGSSRPTPDELRYLAQALLHAAVWLDQQLHQHHGAEQPTLWEGP